MQKEQSRKTFQLKSSLIASVLVIFGFALLFVHEHYFDGNIGVWSTVVHHLSTAFTIAGVWHALEVFFLRSETFSVISNSISEELKPISRESGIIKEKIHDIKGKIHDISDQIHASRHERRLGFSKSFVESHPELYEILISESEELTIVLNNGYVWIHSHIDDLKDRFSSKDKKTTFIMLNCDCEAARLQEKKEHLEAGAYAIKLKETFVVLNDIIKDETNIKFYKTDLPVVQATFLSESKAYLIPRFIIEPSVPPVFVFEKNNSKKSYYRRIKADIDHLLRHQETERCCLKEGALGKC
jgi:hypothetical protein